MKRAYRVKDFCEVYSIPRSSLYLDIAAGKLRIVKHGRSTFIRHADAERWLNSLPSISRRPRKQRARRRRTFSFGGCFKLFIRKWK